MAWQTPKTNWKVLYDSNNVYLGDFFEAEDYTRIANNLMFLQDLSQKMYSVKLQDMPVVTVESLAYASYFNLLEDNLNTLYDKTFRPAGTEATKHWLANGKTPLASDFNRLEKGCFELKKIYDMQLKITSKLAFKLKGSEF